MFFNEDQGGWLVGGWLAAGWRLVGGWLAAGWRLVGGWLAAVYDRFGAFVGLPGHTDNCAYFLSGSAFPFRPRDLNGVELL
jgi:hypothetical protein